MRLAKSKPLELDQSSPPTDDYRTRAANYHKICPRCGRKLHISKRMPEHHVYTCPGCGHAAAISDWFDMTEDEIANAGRIQGLGRDRTD